MKANELRIGNLNIWDESIQANQLSSMQFGDLESKGIVITEDWLPKLLLKTREGHVYFISIGRFTITATRIYDGLYFDINGIRLDIEYVHQFQNIIHALTGTELEIKN